MKKEKKKKEWEEEKKINEFRVRNMPVMHCANLFHQSNIQATFLLEIA